MKKVLAVLILSVFFLTSTTVVSASNNDHNSTWFEKTTFSIFSSGEVGAVTGQENDPSEKQNSNIKTTLKHKSLQQIVADVFELKEGKIGEILMQFFQNSTGWIWIIQEGVLPEDTNASTLTTTEGLVTTLDYNKLKNATKLSVARTVIHELMHAYITLYFRFDQSNAKKDYPGVVAAWGATTVPDYNEIQHEEMEASFVGEIAVALKEYGNKIGLSLNDTIYSDLAWGGLGFQNSTQLSDQDKERIRLRINTEQLNIAFASVLPVGPKLG